MSRTDPLAPGAGDSAGGLAGGQTARVTAALAGVRQRISAAGADPADVTIVAVTKGHGPEAVRAALAAGLTDLGENYAAELLAKHSAFGVDTAAPGGAVSTGRPGGRGARARWHFLGGIQRNKIKGLVPVVSEWHGLDRRAEAESLSAAAAASGCPRPRVYVQVCLSPGPGRAGCAPEELDEILAGIRPRIDVAGLMGVGPPGHPEAARPAFRWLSEAGRRHGLARLSMGMSADFEVAVQEGANVLRLGTVLFGPRSLGAPGPTVSGSASREPNPGTIGS